ncbi:MAG: Uma2 family endonuclease [Lachnospiraceae bacterium]|nr:Uma2 family endonuclease [Lachnospiraceae bacterium]
MTLKEIKARKKKLGWTNKELAQRSGVPLSTVNKIMGNATLTPRIDTLQRIENAMPLYDEHHGGYTLEDYLALPDDVRVELIDGVFYDMGAPLQKHQLVTNQINIIISNFIAANNGTCVPFMPPTDVQLDCDDKTIVQPDFLIVCDKKKLGDGWRIFGAPEFVLEVLSPSTRKKDMTLKLAKYEAAGVKEYWIVDPEKEKVIVYRFGEEEDYDISLYGFTDKVGVGIFDNRCKVDFAAIKKYLKRVYGS